MFICSNCQKQFTKWQGQCDQCKEWGTIEEYFDKTNASTSLSMTRGQKARSKTQNSKLRTQNHLIVKPVKLSQIKPNTSQRAEIKTNVSEFDNTIGGRMVSGQVILLAGSPGVGKSTLSLEIIEGLSKQSLKILYVCGEESPEQIKTRADRLKLKLENVDFLPEYNVANIENYIVNNSDKINFIIIDSIQTLFSPDIASSNGSVSQIAECTNRITSLSKGYSIPTLIIGHVTKSGDIAGPKIMEHMVDTVLYFEGDRKLDMRVLRVEKNRFGSTDEVGLFKMNEEGLSEVKDTKELFELKSEEEVGSAYAMSLEGNRPVVVEVQALATKTYMNNPRRTTSGYDINRLYILLAIIDKKLKLQTYEYDIYVNITGGINLKDAGLDLAVMTSIVSSIKNKPVARKQIYIGEIGLTGEVRKVFLQDKRIKESKRLGFSTVVSSNTLRNIKE